MDEAFGHWLAGFVDGEGTFSLIRSNKDTFAVRFAIKLRADDAPILRDVKRWFGCGIIRFGQRDGRIPKSPYVTYTVNSIRDIIQKVVPLFEQFPLRAKKRRDFELWREAAWLIYHIGNRKQEYLGHLKGQGPKWFDTDRLILEELRLSMIDERIYKNAQFADYLNSKPKQERLCEPKEEYSHVG